MDSDKQIQEAILLEDTIIEDFQNVMMALTDAQTAQNYFENDPENTKILVFLNILIEQLNKSRILFLELNNNPSHKLKLIIQHIKEISESIDQYIKFNTITTEYLQFYLNRLLSVTNVEEKKSFNVSENEKLEVINFLKQIPTTKWDHDIFISKDQLIANLMKRKGKLFLEMQMLWINTIKSDQPKDYGKPLYLRASYQSDILFFGVAVVLCIIVAYFMSQ